MVAIIKALNFIASIPYLQFSFSCVIGDRPFIEKDTTSDHVFIIALSHNQVGLLSKSGVINRRSSDGSVCTCEICDTNPPCK